MTKVIVWALAFGLVGSAGCKGAGGGPAVEPDASRADAAVVATIDARPGIDASIAAPDAMPSTPAITPAGDPIGVGAASATIGPAGGSLVADFGRVTLRVPAGALASATKISITPVENTAPAGLGNAYRLAPDGLVFATPAALTLALDDEDQHTAALDQLGAATQTAGGGWSVGTVTRDTTAQTVTVALPHFSDWSWFQHLSLSAQHQAMFADQSQAIVILETEPFDDGSGPVLPVPSIYTGPVTATWNLIGKGSLTSSADSTIYHAAIPAKNPVLVTATMTLAGGPQVILFARLHVLARKYRVAMAFRDVPNCTPPGGNVIRLIGYHLETSATVDVALDDQFHASLAAPSAADTATVTGLISCPPLYSSALGPGPTPGIAITGIGGGYSITRRRLALTMTGTWADKPDYTETFAGPPVVVTHKPALIEDLKYLSPFLTFEGSDGEHHDYDDVQLTIETDFDFTLTALQW
jgi:hypothetical protein